MDLLGEFRSPLYPMKGKSMKILRVSERLIMRERVFMSEEGVWVMMCVWI